MTSTRLLLAGIALLLLGALAAPDLLPAARAARDRTEATLRALEKRRLTKVSFEDHPLGEVVTWLRVATGFNFVVKQHVLAKAGIDPEELRFTIELEDVSVRRLLDLLLEPHDLAVQVRDNVVHVTTTKDALGRPRTRLYAIGHLTWQKTDFIAPDINLHPSGYTPPVEYEPEQLVEDGLTTGDAVAELVRDLVRPGMWDEEGWSIRATQLHLVVRCPEPVHREVARALAMIATMK